MVRGTTQFVCESGGISRSTSITEHVFHARSGTEPAKNKCQKNQQIALAESSKPRVIGE